MKKLITILALTVLTACSDAKTKSCPAGPVQEDIKDLRAQVEEGTAILRECGSRERNLEGMEIILGVIGYLDSREKSHTMSTAEGRLMAKIVVATAAAEHCHEQGATEEEPELQ